MRKFGLIGFPLSHSWSKKYFQEKFLKENIIDCAYALYPLQDINELPVLLESEKDLLGINVTIPYKTTVIPFLHSVSEEAKEIGAVNVIKIRRTGDKEPYLTGFNSDVTGFIQSLTPLLKGQKNALVLGTGGSSKAVVYALKKLGFKVTSVSRTRGNGILTYSDIDEAIMRKSKIIVNTTPVGMFPDTANKPAIPYKFLQPGHILFDLVYNPETTLFMKMGQEAGCTVVNGYEMLRLQAERAWEIWNDENI
ncbi:MAG TPA: shikimate dehydrogenase [Bacteroidales bacterium]|nr:shikimate dehydrogenase [Bacteroidales bacterium]